MLRSRIAHGGPGQLISRISSWSVQPVWVEQNVPLYPPTPLEKEFGVTLPPHLLDDGADPDHLMLTVDFAAVGFPDGREGGFWTVTWPVTEQRRVKRRKEQGNLLTMTKEDESRMKQQVRQIRWRINYDGWRDG
jgi:hypothetical protein